MARLSELAPSWCHTTFRAATSGEDWSVKTWTSALSRMARCTASDKSEVPSVGESPSSADRTEPSSPASKVPLSCALAAAAITTTRVRRGREAISTRAVVRASSSLVVAATRAAMLADRSNTSTTRDGAATTRGPAMARTTSPITLDCSAASQARRIRGVVSTVDTCGKAGHNERDATKTRRRGRRRASSHGNGSRIDRRSAHGCAHAISFSVVPPAAGPLRTPEAARRTRRMIGPVSEGRCVWHRTLPAKSRAA